MDYRPGELVMDSTECISREFCGKIDAIYGDDGRWDCSYEDFDDMGDASTMLVMGAATAAAVVSMIY